MDSKSTATHTTSTAMATKTTPTTTFSATATNPPHTIATSTPASSTTNPATSTYQYATNTVDPTCMTELECQAYVCNSEIQKATLAIMVISLVANAFILAGWLYRRRMKKKFERQQLVTGMAEAESYGYESDRGSTSTTASFSAPVQRAKVVDISQPPMAGRGGGGMPAMRGGLGASVPMRTDTAAKPSAVGSAPSAARGGLGGVSRGGSSIGAGVGRVSGSTAVPSNGPPAHSTSAVGIGRGTSPGPAASPPGGGPGAGRGRGGASPDLPPVDKSDGAPKSNFTPYRKPAVDDDE